MLQDDGWPPRQEGRTLHSLKAILFVVAFSPLIQPVVANVHDPVHTVTRHVLSACVTRRLPRYPDIPVRTCSSSGTISFMNFLASVFPGPPSAGAPPGTSMTCSLSSPSASSAWSKVLLGLRYIPPASSTGSSVWLR